MASATPRHSPRRCQLSDSLPRCALPSSATLLHPLLQRVRLTLPDMNPGSTRATQQLQQRKIRVMCQRAESVITGGGTRHLKSHGFPELNGGLGLRPCPYTNRRHGQQHNTTQHQQRQPSINLCQSTSADEREPWIAGTSAQFQAVKKYTRRRRDGGTADCLVRAIAVR